MPASLRAAATRAVWSTVMPFFILTSKRSEAASSPAVTAMHPDAASRRHRSGVKASSKRILPHHEMRSSRSSNAIARAFHCARGCPSPQRSRRGFQRRGRRVFVYEVEGSPVGLIDQTFDLADEVLGRG